MPAGWTDAFSRELTILEDVVAGPRGLIAVGCMADDNGDCLRALLLTSPDGTSWTQADLEGAADTLIWRVRRFGDRLLALGERIDNQRLEVDAVVWTSLDGLSWSEISSASLTNQAISEIVQSPVGTLAIGFNAPYASEGFGVVVWDVEPDGSFGKSRDVHPTGGPDIFEGAAWTGDRYLAWGPGADQGDKVQSTILMASPDGKAWTVLPEIPAFHGSSVMEVIDAGHGLVAVGYQGRYQPTSPRAWTSVDGATWEAADVPSGAGAMYTISVEGSQLLARGEEPWDTEYRPVSWTSTGGDAWTRLADGEDLPAVPGFKALSRAMLDGRACVAGTFYGDPRQPSPRAAIYCR